MLPAPKIGAAFPSGCLGKVLASKGRSVPLGNGLRLMYIFKLEDSGDEFYTAEANSLHTQ